MLSETSRLFMAILFSVAGVLCEDWGVNYTRKNICALKGTSVDFPCTYTYPRNLKVQKTFWFIYNYYGQYDDLYENPQYRQRVQYFGNKEHDCTFRINHLTWSDSATYHFRFLTDKTEGRYTGAPGVTLTVTALQVSVNPNTVTEGQRVTLSGSPTFIWYKNRHALSNTNQNLQFSASSEDASSYSCAVKGYEHHPSTAKSLNVEYSPKNTSVSLSPSGEIVEGSSVTLTCSSNASPPVQSYTWFKKNETGVWQTGSGQSLNFTNFTSWNSGQYYCEARNKIGNHNSSVLLVTIQGKRTRIVITVEIPVFVVLLLAILWMRKRNSTKETECTEVDTKENESPVYSNMAGMAFTHNATQSTDRGNEEIAQYTTLEPAHSENEDDVQYASIQFPLSSAATRSPVQTVEDDSVLYSTVTKCKT